MTTHQSSTPPRSAGRPPLYEKSMTPKTLNARKHQLYHKSEKQSKQKEKKSKAAKLQWKMRLATHDSSDSDDLGNDVPDIVSDKLASQEPPVNMSDESPECGVAEQLDNPVDGNDSTRRVQRHRALCRFLPLLPTNVIDSMKLFIRCYNIAGESDQLKQQLTTLDIPNGQLGKNQLYYKQGKLCQEISAKQVPLQHELFAAWLSRLLSHPSIV